MRRANKIAVSIVLGIGGICLLGGYAVIYGQFGRYASQRDAELAAARKEGLPTEAQDLVRTVPPEQNAAPTYVKGIKVLEDKSLEPYRKVIADAQLKGASKADLRNAGAALAKFDPMLNEVQRASELPECAFDRNWALGPALLLPEYAHLKTFSKMFATRAELASLQGDWRSALKDIRTEYRLAQHTGQDPILIGMLVQVAQESIANRSLEMAIGEHGRNPEFLREAAKLAGDVGPLPNLRHALGGEIVFGRVAIPMIEGRSSLMMDVSYDGGEPQKPFFMERAFFQSKPVQGAFETKLIQFWRETFRDLPKDPEKWEEALKVMGRLETRLGSDRSPANWANQMLMPVFSNAAAVNGKVMAQRRMTRAAIQVLEYRAKEGTFPKSLPADAIDPYSGKPFVYKIAGDGFKIWSVGEDRADNGGVTQSEASGKAFDLVFRYPFPARPAKSPAKPKSSGHPAGFPGGPGFPMPGPGMAD